ncbi:hypothetical protein CCR95_22270 [Thiocystis minor]|nr:hypothetical protein [Thiocystis minor]
MPACRSTVFTHLDRRVFLEEIDVMHSCRHGIMQLCHYAVMRLSEFRRDAAVAAKKPDMKPDMKLWVVLL